MQYGKQELSQMPANVGGSQRGCRRAPHLPTGPPFEFMKVSHSPCSTGQYAQLDSRQNCRPLPGSQWMSRKQARFTPISRNRLESLSKTTTLVKGPACRHMKQTPWLLFVRD